MPIRKKGDTSGAKKRFDPRTGEETNKPGGKDPRTIYRPKPDVKPTEMRTGGLSPKQKAIASKAPPPNKITGADFAVLKKEKAKGRGMGLQDESIKPGKVMKAKTGKMTPIKKDPTTPVNPFEKRRKKLGGGGKLPGKIGTALGVISMLVPAGMAAAKQYKDYKSAKNRDKAKVKKFNKGGGADTGKVGEIKSKISVAMDRASRRARDKDRLTTRDKEEAVNIIRRRSRNEDRMTNRDMESASSAIKGYRSGTMVKARGCKLGRSKPTKMY